MAQSSIISGQYVELTLTPASVGDRLFAAIIDYIALIVYSLAAAAFGYILLDSINSSSDVVTILIYVIIFAPVAFYYPICEIFTNGQSLGKKVMKMRVVSIDGKSPSVGSCFLRWILYLIDTFFTGFLGIVFIVFGKYRQRLGDLAAGTIVIKTTANQYDFFSLYDYNYIQPGYEPTYPEAANLSTRQVDVISRALYNTDPNRRNDLTYRLAVKVQQYLDVQLTESMPADAFLWTVLNDFYHYSSTIEV